MPQATPTRSATREHTNAAPRFGTSKSATRPAKRLSAENQQARRLVLWNAVRVRNESVEVVAKRFKCSEAEVISAAKE